MTVSAVRVVFFDLESNIGPLFELLNRFDANSFHHSQKVTISKYLLSSFQQFCGNLFVLCVVYKLLYSSSTWWAIVAQYKDFKIGMSSRRVKTIVNNSAADSYIFLL